jgi:mannosyl-oligosaccharide glucosidase
LIYHLGLEGLGSFTLDQDVDEQSNGIEGDISLTGSSAEFGDFRIRIVDHPEIVTSIRGNHHQLFADNEGKTSFLGVNLPDGQVWRIKDVLSQSINAQAQTIMVDNGFEPNNPPDPAYLFRLQNTVQSLGESGAAANVWALQKVGVGSGVSGGNRWGFDVFFESVVGGVADEWTCKYACSTSPFFPDGYPRR